MTNIRGIAERSRTFGGAGAGRGLVGATPKKLHLIATHMESEMRGLLHVDEVVSASFWDSTSDAGPALKTIDFPGLRIVPTVVAPHTLSVEVQVSELRSVVADLYAVIDDLYDAVDTSAIEYYAKLITAEINGIEAFAAAIA